MEIPRGTDEIIDVGFKGTDEIIDVGTDRGNVAASRLMVASVVEAPIA